MKTFTQLKINDRKMYLNYGKKAVSFSNIKYIESIAGNYSMIRLLDKGSICSAFTLKHYYSQLDTDHDFILVRKGLLVNIKYAKEVFVEGGIRSLKMSTGEVFKLSRRQGPKVEECLKNAEMT
jgi:DNA-binding LytR/AlgR family response regulator